MDEDHEDEDIDLSNLDDEHFTGFQGFDALDNFPPTPTKLHQSSSKKMPLGVTLMKRNNMNSKNSPSVTDRTNISMNGDTTPRTPIEPLFNTTIDSFGTYNTTNPTPMVQRNMNPNQYKSEQMPQSYNDFTNEFSRNKRRLPWLWTSISLAGSKMVPSLDLESFQLSTKYNIRVSNMLLREIKTSWLVPRVVYED